MSAHERILQLGEERIKGAWITLTPRERRVVAYCVGMHCQRLTSEQIARELDLAPTWVREIEAHVLRKIR